MKRFAIYFSFAVGVLLLFELSIRLFFATQIGPSILFYGTSLARNHVNLDSTQTDPNAATKKEAKTYKNILSIQEWRERRSVIKHENKVGNYSKYYPNQKRLDFDITTGEKFEVKINEFGFRGENFSVEKNPNSIRILTLGASSTFGYFNRDDETYPVQLQAILNDIGINGKTIEVINLGIPHLKSESILDLFLAEGLVLNPDIVTFYEGNNDAQKILRTYNPVDDQSSQDESFSFQGYFILVDWIASIVSDKARNQYLPERLRLEGAEISKNFLSNIKAIHKACKNREILFIIANQQKNSQTLTRSDLRKYTYKEEVNMVLAKLLAKEKLTNFQVSFLVHSFMMGDIEEMAKKNEIPYVDIIDLMDKDRDFMVSWVHLNAEGNRIIANALATEILFLSNKIRNGSQL